jgi:diguanylate cyclase (GGDEF)-like protein
LLLLPGAFAVMALGLLVYGTIAPLNAVAIGLAATTLALVIVRGGMSFAENLRLLARASHEAQTDELTGLKNRRCLMQDLQDCIDSAHAADSWSLALFDLDGFKKYNDTLGHHAGDVLLKRIADHLLSAVGPHGHVYRIGGDEFCALLRPAAPQIDTVIASVDFQTGVSYGVVALPLEARTPLEALQLVDSRMYVNKHQRRVSER